MSVQDKDARSDSTPIHYALGRPATVNDPVAPQPTVVVTPWKHPDLEGWAIVGMNHYIHNDEMFLFVAMTSGNYCIKAEGPDDSAIWADLRQEARAIDARLERETEEAIRAGR